MAKNDNFIEVTIKLPRDFKGQLSRAAEDELVIAQKKWGVRLDEARKENLLELAFAQLENKVSAVGKAPWALGDKTMTVFISVPAIIESSAISFPMLMEEREKVETMVYLSNETWHLDDEPTADSTRLGFFDKRFLSGVEAWLRTGVFYGVGSYV